MLEEHPWRELPPGVAGTLRPLLPELADEIIEAVRTVPAYARPMEGVFAAGVRAGVEAALAHFLAEVESGREVERPDVYDQLGRGEMRAGRTLESLLSAYRAGARMAWRRFAAAGVRAGLEPNTLYALAESIFAYIDVLSAESAAGHAAEQSAAAGESGLQRRRLVRLLVRAPAPDAEELAAAAISAGWELPRSLAILAIGGEARERVASWLPGGTLAETLGEIVCAVIPDPEGPGRRARLDDAVRAVGARAGLGTAGEPTEAARSLARARAALSLAGEGEVVGARERAGELLLSSDSELAQRLVTDRLEALRDLPAGTRERLTETLAVWLAEQGRLGAVAARLGVHPQTARYRIGRLRDLFGKALDNPEERFWLEVALRMRNGASASG